MKMPKSMKMPEFGGAEGKKNQIYAAAAAAGLVVIALVLTLIGGGGNSSSEEGGVPRIVSVEELQESFSGQDPPVYWAGERPGAELELSQPAEGQTYVRYLTGGAEAGDERPNFLTVGTYVLPDAVATLRRQGREPGGVLASAAGNATVYFAREEPHSVYLAYPGVDVEIEVYDPSFKRALQLVNSGQIVTVN
jgi:hypothetical protein